MTEAQIESMKTAKTKSAEKRLEARSKKIIVGDYVVWQYDESNWVYHKATEGEVSYRYYPTVKDAMKALLNRLIGEKCKYATNVEAVLVAIKWAEDSILSAVSKLS